MDKNSVTVKIPIEKIRKGKNIRNDDIEIEDLKTSINNHGLLQAVIVRKCKESDGYFLIAGHRRLLACAALGWTEIEAKVQDFKNDMVVQLTENLQRKDMTMIEESECIHNLNEKLKVSPGRLAKLIGKDTNWTNKRLRYYQVRKHLLSSGLFRIPLINKMSFDIANIVGKYEQKYWIQMCAYLLGKRWYPENIEEYCKSVIDPEYKPRKINIKKQYDAFDIQNWKEEDGFSMKSDKVDLKITVYCTTKRCLNQLITALEKAGGELL